MNAHKDAITAEPNPGGFGSGVRLLIPIKGHLMQEGFAEG